MFLYVFCQKLFSRLPLAAYRRNYCAFLFQFCKSLVHFLAVSAERLHFADAASFSKFFLRNKGMSPKQFREEG